MISQKNLNAIVSKLEGIEKELEGNLADPSAAAFVFMAREVIELYLMEEF